MRRLCGTLAAILLLVSSLILVVGAADYETNGSTWANVELHALYVQDNMKLSSDINPDFRADWPIFSVPEAGDEAVTSTINMRGFALSPDGRFAYMSVLHGGGDKVRGMFVMETMTGKILAYDTRYDGDVCDAALPHFSYPKGVDTDTRGYVYMGYTLSESFNETYLRIARQNEDGSLTRVCEIPVCSLGRPGNENGTKVGINGVCVAEVDGRVYAYIVTNYDHDALYRFDVTDPENPILDKDFGRSGRILSDAFDLKGYALDEALYLDVGADGTLYVAVTATDGRGGVAVIAPDGSSCRKVIACDGVYSVEIAGNFLLCGARTGGTITVLNRTTGRQVTTLSIHDSYGERITRMQIANDVLFVCDAGSVAGQSNAVYAAPLSEAGQAFLDEIVLSQDRGYAVYETLPETFPETQPSSGETSPESRPTESVTDTPADSESTPLSPSETSPATTDGCASVLPLWGLFSLAAGVMLLKKRP